MWLINCAFVGQKNFDIIETHGATTKIRILYFVGRASLYNIVNKANLVQNLFLVYLFLNIFIYLYTFWVTMCPSSGETTVFMRQLVVVILCGWLTGMHSTLHTRQSSKQNNKYRLSHKHRYFSWWLAHSRPKHVEKRNKHSKKNCAPKGLYLQDNKEPRPYLQYTGRVTNKNK
jgi:hypothetical protein